MERGGRPGVTTFYSTLLHEGEIDLGEEAAHHAHVKRMSVGDDVTVTNGVGFRGAGRITSLGKRSMAVTIAQMTQDHQPAPLHLYVPVADRDRMLWLAEKATELQVTTLTPVMYHRSRSVSPRGEGDAFDRKLRGRAIAALEQSDGAWLPGIDRVLEPSELRLADGLPGFVLERGGPSLARHSRLVPGVSIAVGPEGGFEPDELALLQNFGWVVASIGDVTLRFETAAIAGASIARAMISTWTEDDDS